jgi:hypothetical protein
MRMNLAGHVARMGYERRKCIGAMLRKLVGFSQE